MSFPRATETQQEVANLFEVWYRNEQPITASEVQEALHDFLYHYQTAHMVLREAIWRVRDEAATASALAVIRKSDHDLEGWRILGRSLDEYRDDRLKQRASLAWTTVMQQAAIDYKLCLEDNIFAATGIGAEV